jgi:hypothetical protein
MYPGILRLDHVPHHSSYASCATSFKLCFIPYLASSEQFIVVKLLLLLLDHDAHGGGTPGLVIGISSVRHCCINSDRDVQTLCPKALEDAHHGGRVVSAILCGR